MLLSLSTLWDGWTDQAIGEGRSQSGGVDAWTFLRDKHGSTSKSLIRINDLIRPIIDFACREHKISPHVRFACGGLRYGPSDYPVNVLIYMNDLLKWIPEDFRELELKYQFHISWASAPHFVADMIESVGLPPIDEEDK